MAMSKNAYLTIDDAPTEDFRQKVDYLSERQVPAIFFCRGDFLEARMDNGVYAIQKGYALGNHAYDHPYFSTLSLDECFRQIDRTHAIIEDAYNRAEAARPGNYFRFPYGDKGDFRKWEWWKETTPEGVERHDAIQSHLRAQAYEGPDFFKPSYQWYFDWGLDQDVDWPWTYDCREYRLKYENAAERDGVETIEDVLALMDQALPSQNQCLSFPGSEDMVLLHDHAASTKYFMTIVDRLSKKVRFAALP